ncbi:MFS transporter [Streptomyces pseudovenezuelae]|uniref:MFS family permease n=1 Tax=Streptomyces pseudovenezuelae TaxID=67350 RepID=A0ABT6LDB8_9ACTN|nr:MFS transporter [Streptomyces pseudovenezuelae]MDH6214313.1 MFS family permease [Streptomyces pseudovenezuelae]
MAYRSLLRVPDAGFFPLGFLARLPYATSSLATLILVRAASGSYAFAGLAAATQGIAIAVGGPVVGALSDRHGHRSIGAVMAVANIVALTGLVVASHTDRASMLVAAALAGLTQPQVGPMVRVHWSRLLHARDQQVLMPTALSYEATADETSFIVGPAIVGLLTPIGPTAPTVAAMVLLAVATLPFALSLSQRAGMRQPTPKTSRTPLPRRPLAAMFLAMAAMGAVFGAVQTGVTAFADGSGRPGTAGLLYATFGIGSALAGAACAWLPPRFTLRHRYMTFAATLLLGGLTLVVGDRLHAVPAAVAIAGVTVAPYMISLYALTERLAPPDRANVTMTIVCGGGPLGTAAGQALAGFLADSHGSAGAFLVAPIAATAALLLALAVLFADRRLPSAWSPVSTPG